MVQYKCLRILPITAASWRRTATSLLLCPKPPEQGHQMQTACWQWGQSVLTPASPTNYLRESPQSRAKPVPGPALQNEHDRPLI